MPFRNSPPPAHSRKRVGAPLDLGVRALNTFLTCCRGQRLGIFAGSGVGKSVLLSMLARNVDADITVIGLVGERGREVQEFLQDDLGRRGAGALGGRGGDFRRAGLDAAAGGLSDVGDRGIFPRRGQGRAVPDGFGDALRDGAARDRAVGGRTADRQGIYADRLHRIAEAAGARRVRAPAHGTITGIFTVLVDGDDHNEPIADAVRGILDGHMVMERAIAERGRFPAINILKSVSRTMPKSADPAYLPVITKGRQVMATYADMEELIRLGAYRTGSSAEVDQAIRLHEPLEGFLRQAKDEVTGLNEGYRQLEQILSHLETES